MLIAAGRADPTQSLARVLLTSDPGDESHCGRKRFQDIASRLFLHRAHTHQLITRSERAAALGIGAGTRVTFRYRGKLLQGRVNRITKSATVLVEDPEGTRWSDGRRYVRYYVPLGGIRAVEADGAPARRPERSRTATGVRNPGERSGVSHSARSADRE